MQFLSYPLNPFGYHPFPPLIRQAFHYPFNASIGQMQGFPQNYNLGEVIPLMPESLRAQYSAPILPSITIAPLPRSGSNERKMYYFCRFCSSYECEDVNDFKHHLTIHSAKSRPFVCQLCFKSYGFRSLWRNHIVVHMTVRGKGKTKLSTEQDSHNSGICCTK